MGRKLDEGVGRLHGMMCYRSGMKRLEVSFLSWVVVAAVGTLMRSACRDTRSALTRPSALTTRRAEFGPAELPEGSPPSSCRVQTIQGGRAEYTEGDSAWLSLTNGQVVWKGARIRTSAAAVCTLSLKQNGPVVRLGPGASLTLQRLRRGAVWHDEEAIETRLILEAGELCASVKKLVPKSSFEVKTPLSVYRVNGTQFDINTDGPLAVIEGTVEFG